MACNYFINTSKFDSYQDLKDYLRTQSFNLSDKGQIEDITSSVRRNLSSIKKDYGNTEFSSTKVYKRAADIFTDLIDLLMYPQDAIYIEDSDLINIPLSRKEAILQVYDYVKSNYEELRDRIQSGEELNEDENLEFRALAAMNSKEVYKRLVDDIYPDFLPDEGQPNLDDVEANNDWLDKDDITNPIRKASQAVKDIMHTVITYDSQNKPTRVRPGFVFKKLMETLYNIDITDITNNSQDSAELAQLEENFKKAKMKVGDKSNREYQIYSKIRELIEKTRLSRDSNGKSIPTTLAFEWVGDNQKGHYIFKDYEKQTILNFKGFSTQDIFKNVQNYLGYSGESGLDIIKVLYEKQEAANTLNSLYNVLASMKLNNPVFAEYSYYFVKGGKIKVSRKYKPFKNEVHLSGPRDRVKTAFKENINKLTPLLSKIHQAQKGNIDKSKAVKSIMEGLQLLPSDSVYIGKEEASGLLADFEGIINKLLKVDTIIGKNEDNEDIIYTTDMVFDDSANYIRSIGEYIAKDYSENEKSTSYQSGDKTQRWFYSNSNQAIDTLNKIITNKKQRGYLDLDYFKYNIFNPNGNPISKIYGFYDHDSIYDKTSNQFSPDPISYKSEDMLSWYERNFFYGFVNWLGNERTGKKYIQQFYTISDKPKIVGAEINLLNPQELRNAISRAIEQEVNRPDYPTLKTYKKNTSYLGIDYDFKKAKEDSSYKEEVITKVLNNLSQRSEQAVEKFINLSPTLDYSNKGKAYKEIFNSLRNDKYIESDVDIDSEFILFEKNKKPLTEDDFNVAKSYILPTFDLLYKNYFINSIFLNQLVAGDQAQYKSSYDQIKRMSIVFAQGTKGRVNDESGLKRTYNTVVIKDVNKTVEGKLLEPFKKLLNKKYDITDAQGFATPERMNNIRKGFSREANIGSTAKPVYFGIGDDGIARAVKYSTIELTDELCKTFAPLKQLRFEMTFGSNNFTPEQLEEVKDLYNKRIEGTLNIKESFNYENYVSIIQDAGNHIDEAVFASAVKVGLPKTLSTYNESNNTFSLIAESKMVLLNANYRHQLNPRHEVVGKTSNMTQLTYQLNTNAKNFERLSKVLKLNSLLHENGIEDIKSRFLNEEGIPNRGIVRSALISQLGKVAGNERTVEFLQSKTTSLNLPFIVNKLQQSFIASISKETVEIKHRGSKLTLQSSIGTKSKEIVERENLTEPQLKMFRKGKDGELIQVSDGNKADTYYMEAYIPEEIYHSLKQNGMTDNQIFSEPIYANILGFRIPSTELHSAVPIKVIGWYPNKYSDNIIIAPKELVVLHGSDFDIDSLYTVNPYISTENFFTLDGKQIAYMGRAVGYDKNNKPITKEPFTQFIKKEILSSQEKSSLESQPILVKQLKGYISSLRDLISKAASNEILAVFMETITARENLDDMMTPIDLGNFNDLDNSESVFNYLISLKEKNLPKGYPSKPENESELEDWKVGLLKPVRNLNYMDDELEMHQDNFRAKALTGSFANAFKIISYIFMGTNNFGEENENFNFSESEQKLPKLKEDYHIDLDGNIYNGFSRYVIKDGILQDGNKGTPRVTIWQNLDSMINAAIDHVKEQILNVINASQKTGNAFVSMVAMGIPIDKVSLFMTQPVIQEISNRARDSKAVDKIKTELKSYIFEKSIEEDSELKLEIKSINDSTLLSDEDKKEKINSLKLKLLDNLIPEDIKLNTSKMESAYGKFYGDTSQFSVQEYVDQYMILKQFEKLDNIGKNFLFKGSVALRSLQQLAPSVPELQDSLSNLNAWSDVDNFLFGTEVDQNILENNPFENVNLLSVPNIQSSTKVVNDTIDMVGKIFIRDIEKFKNFSDNLDSKLLQYGSKDILDKETGEVIGEKENTEKSGFLDRNKFKSSQYIRNSFIEYLLSGLSYQEGNNLYTMSTLNEPTSEVETISKVKDPETEEWIKTKDVKELTGTAAWINRFLYQGFKKDNRILKSIETLKKQYGNSGANKFLQQLIISKNEDGIPYLRFALGTLDSIEKIDYEDSFNELSNLSIYTDENGNDIAPEVIPGTFNELQHNLLKYAILDQGLSFGSQNYSSLMNVDLFGGISKNLDHYLFGLFENKGKLDISKLIDNFTIQLAVQNVKKLQNINKLIEKDNNKPIFGKEIMEDGSIIYYDAKSSKGKEELPIFGAIGNTSYIQVYSDNKFTYFQKIERNDSSKSYQFDENLLSGDYKIQDYFNKNILALGYTRKEINSEGDIEIKLSNRYEPKVSIVENNNTVYIYDRSNYSRIGMLNEQYKVKNKTIGLDNLNREVTTLTLSKVSEQKESLVTDKLIELKQRGLIKFTDC